MMHMNQEQLYLENHTAHEEETCTLTLVRTLILYAYCVPGSVHGAKIRKSTVRSLMQQATEFSSTRLSAQGNYGAGSCSFLTVQKPCQFKKWNRKRRPKILADRRSSSILQSLDTVDSAFLSIWHNRVCAWPA